MSGRSRGRLGTTPAVLEILFAPRAFPWRTMRAILLLGADRGLGALAVRGGRHSYRYRGYASAHEVRWRRSSGTRGTRSRRWPTGRRAVTPALALRVSRWDPHGRTACRTVAVGPGLSPLPATPPDDFADDGEDRRVGEGNEIGEPPPSRTWRDRIERSPSWRSYDQSLRIFEKMQGSVSLHQPSARCVGSGVSQEPT